VPLAFQASFRGSAPNGPGFVSQEFRGKLAGGRGWRKLVRHGVLMNSSLAFGWIHVAEAAFLGLLPAAARHAKTKKNGPGRHEEKGEHPPTNQEAANTAPIQERAAERKRNGPAIRSVSKTPCSIPWNTTRQPNRGHVFGLVCWPPEVADVSPETQGEGRASGPGAILGQRGSWSLDATTKLRSRRPTEAVRPRSARRRAPVTIGLEQRSRVSQRSTRRSALQPGAVRASTTGGTGQGNGHRWSGQRAWVKPGPTVSTAALALAAAA